MIVVASMGMSHRNAMFAATSMHKMPNQHLSHNNTSQFYTSTSPGTVNILLGGAMLGTMILFFVWMCYFCRCKVPKSEETSSTTSTPPYWIDIDSDTNDRGYNCEDEIYNAIRRYSGELSIRRPSPPPTYESVFNLPPTYEDALKSMSEKKDPKSPS
ncbi:hypothetical protein V9T40_005000 [Parthenolecanium corni]|uniref:Uncharacterized protein n=1 Tax=Parthenolecanium corni TaxID=536013 RepID=A0AAN9TRA2_9HEMI